MTGSPLTYTRQVSRERTTKETSISLRLAIDGSGQVEVSTGLPP